MDPLHHDKDKSGFASSEAKFDEFTKQNSNSSCSRLSEKESYSFHKAPTVPDNYLVRHSHQNSTESDLLTFAVSGSSKVSTYLKSKVIYKRSSRHVLTSVMSHNW